MMMHCNILGNATSMAYEKSYNEIKVMQFQYVIHKLLLNSLMRSYHTLCKLVGVIDIKYTFYQRK